jgi:hypothetical protein
MRDFFSGPGDLRDHQFPVVRPTLVLHAMDDPWIPAASYTAIDWSRLPMRQG